VPDPTTRTVARDGGRFQLLTSIPTGNPHTDLDFFTKGGETYAAVGTLAIGGNQGGQSIVKLTEGGQVEPNGRPAARFVTGHPSATCPTNPSQALNLQHDVEATPKSAGVINNDSYLPADAAKTGDAQLLVDATDGTGRCHDQGNLGLQSAPRGGLELIDITGLGSAGFGTGDNRTREIALTSHVGESHTVNIDPQRPHIAYSVTSDSVNVSRSSDGGTPNDPTDDTFVRNNETTQTSNLDGFEVVDMSSCLTPPFGTMREGLTLAEKRDACRPEVYRYRYPTLAMSQGHTIKAGSTNGTFGCHELAPYPGDLLACGSGSAAMLFDMSGAFERDAATGLDKPKGTPLDCRRRPSSNTGLSTPITTGALVTDCVVGNNNKDLRIPAWLADGAPSLEGVRHMGSQHHIGRAATEGFATTVPATEDIDFNHETEFTPSGRYLLATDERGGGVAGGAQCNIGQSNPQTNGGIHAYRVDRLQPAPAAAPNRAPGAPEPGTTVTRPQSDEGYARSYTGNTTTPEGKAIYRAPTRSEAVEGTFCTAHVLQQVPGQNRIVMGWYTQATNVIDFVELPGNRVQFVETAQAIPANSNAWVSHIFKADQNADGTFTYYGASADTLAGPQQHRRLQDDAAGPLEVCDLQSGSSARATESKVTDRSQARSVHVQNVDCVLNYKISSGKTLNADGTPATYAPTERVTRGQMASFIANALIRSRDDDGVLPAAGPDRFSDISTNTHRAAINRLAQAGIVRGLTGPGGRFAPEQLISRDQMASFIAEASRFANGTPLEPTRRDYFGDVPAGNVHERNISAGFEAGLFQGTTAPGGAPRSGSFSPAVQVQRDQMATFLVRLFKNTLR
jgi:hypothetical protein